MSDTLPPWPPNTGLPGVDGLDSLPLLLTSDSLFSGFLPFSGFAIWTWDVSVALWILVEDRSAVGFEPGSGPTGPGRFHGQAVRWACVPSPPTP